MPTPHDLASDILPDFFGIESRDEAWNNTARSLTENWNPYDGGGDGFISSFILGIALEIGDIATATKFASFSKADSVEPAASWVQILTKHRQFDLARKILVKHWKKFGYADSWSGFRYDDDFPAAAAELVTTLEDADIRFFTELILAASEDPRGMDELEILQEQTMRVTEVAKRFPQSGIKYVPTRRRLLTLIADFPSAADTIAEEYAEAANSFTFSEYSESADSDSDHHGELDSESWQIRQLYLTHARQRIASEGAPAVERYLNLLATSIPAGNDPFAGSVKSAGGILDAIIRGSLGDWSQFPQENLASTAKGWREFIGRQGKAQFVRITDYGYFERFEPAGFTYVIHALADDLAGLDQWRTGLEKDAAALYAKASTKQITAILDCLEIAFDNADLDATQRVELLNRIFSDRVLKASTLNRIVARNLISEDEFLEHGTTIAMANPCQGFMAIELAKQLLKNDRLDEAIAAYDLAIGSLPDDSMTLYTTFHLEKAELLVTAGKKAAALELLDHFDALRIPIRDKKQWKQRLEELRNKANQLP